MNYNVYLPNCGLYKVLEKSDIDKMFTKEVNQEEVIDY